MNAKGIANTLPLCGVFSECYICFLHNIYMHTTHTHTHTHTLICVYLYFLSSYYDLIGILKLRVIVRESSRVILTRGLRVIDNNSCLVRYQ